ncbi:MAG: hypothetical protein HY817_03560 [Candidatus Abawacabacteria bacterium]|nr:hypothetical protein [Candidatus Abawacabacteria bacterium]
MAASRFEKLKTHWGKPITVESGVGIPAAASLPTHVGPDAERIYKQTWAKALAATAVTRESIANCIDTVGSALYAQGRKRVGPKDNFYVLNSAGSVLYQARTNDTSFAQMLSSAEVYAPLSDRAKGMAVHENAHVSSISDMLVPDDGVVFETGAGTDWNRIKLLDELARTKGAQLVCHDLLPVTTHEAKREVPNVPYLAMMPDPELIADCLAPWKGRKLSFTLKNTISSMAFGEMDDVFEAAKRTGAEQVVITQSLGFSPHANVFFMALRPQSIALSHMILPRLVQDGRVPLPFMLAAVEQAHLTLMNVMLEMTRYRLGAFAKDAGLNSHETCITEHTTILEPADDMSVLDNTNFSHSRELWQTGGFNAMAFSPFGCHKTLDPKVPRGKLKLTTQQIHLRFGKKPTENLPGNKIAETDMLCARKNVLHDFIDSTDLLSPVRNLAKTRSMLAQPHLRNAIEDANRVGVEMGLRIAFEVYVPNHPQLQGLPAELRERIVKGYIQPQLF